MAQTPLNKMSHIPGKMSEESEYVLVETKAIIDQISKILESKLDYKDLKILIDKVNSTSNVEQKDFNKLISELSEKPSNKDLKLLAAIIEKDLVKVEDFRSLCEDYHSKVINKVSVDELSQNINNLSNKVDKIYDALLSLAQKLDADDVTNLDTDYEETTDTNLQ